MVHHSVLVLDVGLPRFRFLPWFLGQAGIAAASAATVDEAGDHVRETNTDAVVVNCIAPSVQVAEVVSALRRAAPNAWVVAYEPWPPEGSVGADLAISGPQDVDDVIVPLLAHFTASR